VSWLGAVRPPRVELQQVDPAKLEAIRQQWKRNQPQGILLDKDKNRPSEKDAPKDARYLSDRNIRVEKEQRAKETNILPKPGHPNAETRPLEEKAQRATPSEQTPAREMPKLGNLGVPFKLTPNRKAQDAKRARAGGVIPPSEQGGDQFVDEKNLPVGSENLLNAQESVFYSFYARLYEAIGPIWQSNVHEVPRHRRVDPGDYSTTVDVVLDREGHLIRVRYLNNSGIREFDDAVEKSWHRVGHFPNPPSGLVNENGEVHTGWTFTVQVGAGFNMEYLPPERNY
jgi:hypothetical protein